MLSKKSHRNNKQLYYSLNFLKLLIPNFLYRNSIKKNLDEIEKYDDNYIKMRVNFYNKLDRDINLSENIFDMLWFNAASLGFYTAKAIEEIEKRLNENFFSNAISRINFSLLDLRYEDTPN